MKNQDFLMSNDPGINSKKILIELIYNYFSDKIFLILQNKRLTILNLKQPFFFIHVYWEICGIKDKNQLITGI